MKRHVVPHVKHAVSVSPPVPVVLTLIAPCIVWGRCRLCSVRGSGGGRYKTGLGVVVGVGVGVGIRQG